MKKQIVKFITKKIVVYGKNTRISEAVCYVAKNDKNIFKFLTTFCQIKSLIYKERLFSLFYFFNDL